MPSRCACSAGTSIQPQSRPRWQALPWSRRGPSGAIPVFFWWRAARQFSSSIESASCPSILGDAAVRPDHSPGGAAGHRDDAAAADGGGARRRRAHRAPAAMTASRRARAGGVGILERDRTYPAACGVRGHHRETRGMAARFTAQDLVVVESRNASDVHVLALPLAYIYGRPVLVLNSPKPDKAMFEEFLAWARQHYRAVYFIGGGGTDLLSRPVAVESVASERFQIPEYESLRNQYPTGVRFKEFDFGIYKFVPPPPAARRDRARHRRSGRPAGRAIPRQRTRSAWHVPMDARALVPEPDRGACRRQRAGALDGQRGPAGGRPRLPRSKSSSAMSPSGGSSSGLACRPTGCRFRPRSPGRPPRALMP